MSEVVAHYLVAAWGLPSASPFCLKLDAWLRLTGIAHRVVIDAAPFGGPKGKAPWIEHEGRKIGDSGFIIDYLAKRFAVDPDAGLSPAERASALALRRLIEEHLYWTIVYDRWIVDANWAGFRDTVLGGLPAPLRPLIGAAARRSVRAQLKGHGLGRHAHAEIHAIGRLDIVALSEFLGDKPFFMGAVPTGIDAVAYGFLANIVEAPIATPIKDAAIAHANLPAFLERFKARYYA